MFSKEIILASILYLFIVGNAKAYVNYKIGDTSSKKYITLNPIKHIEPIGLILMIFFSVGWGTVIETNSYKYNDRKKGILLVGAVPIILSFTLGYITNMTLLFAPSLNANVIYFLNMFMYISFANGFFNLIPINPLHCEKIFRLYGNPNIVMKMSSYEKILQMLLVIFITTNIFRQVINILMSLVIIS